MSDAALRKLVEAVEALVERGRDYAERGYMPGEWDTVVDRLPAARASLDQYDAKAAMVEKWAGTAEAVLAQGAPAAEGARVEVDDSLQVVIARRTYADGGKVVIVCRTFEDVIAAIRRDPPALPRPTPPPGEAVSEEELAHMIRDAFDVHVVGPNLATAEPVEWMRDVARAVLAHLARGGTR